MLEVTEKIQKILALGLTQKEVAKRVGLSQGQVSKLVSGQSTNPDSNVCLALAGICPHPDRAFWIAQSGIDREALESIAAALQVNETSSLTAAERDLLEWWRSPSSPTEGYVRDLVEKLLHLRTKQVNF